MEEIHLKFAMSSDQEMLGLKNSSPTRESVAFTRYADVSPASDDQKYIFQHPRGEPIRRAFRGDLFKFHKAASHW